jgi:TetR/AcrR family transcriptional regulator, transcriptional repressor for nem operon
MDTKAALLDSAETAVRERGYDGFSYADLAAAVGIRKASVHHHFPAKADLAEALIERYSHAVFARLDEIDALQPSAGGRLAALVATYRAATADGTKLCLCVAFCTGRDSLSPAVLVILDAFRLRVAGWLSEVFILGKTDGSIAGVSDPLAEAQACLAQLEGAQLVARAAKDCARFDAAVARLLERITQS